MQVCFDDSTASRGPLPQSLRCFASIARCGALGKRASSEQRCGRGGWRWPYEWFDEALHAAGFDGRPTSEGFLDGDVLFISGSESTCDLLLRYMRNTYGDDVEMCQVDEIAGGMNVYEFARAGE